MQLAALAIEQASAFNDSDFAAAASLGKPQ
jgi:hypothetical protein